MTEAAQQNRATRRFVRLSGLLLTWGLFRYRLLDLVPVARTTVFESMTDGILVMDEQWRIVDANPTAQQLLASRLSDLVGQTAEQVLAPVIEERGHLEQFLTDEVTATERQPQVTIGQGDSQRRFSLLTTTLRGPRDQLGRMMGEILVALLLPAINAASAAEQEAIARDQLLQAAFAAEVYHRDQQRYPEQLAQLAPKYLARVSLDPLSGKPYRFRAVAGGLELYSVGRNGKDDGGRNHHDNPEVNDAEWDDVIIRVGVRR